jgi:hypothetical protein
MPIPLNKEVREQLLEELRGRDLAQKLTIAKWWVLGRDFIGSAGDKLGGLRRVAQHY